MTAVGRIIGMRDRRDCGLDPTVHFQVTESVGGINPRDHRDRMMGKRVLGDRGSSWPTIGDGSTNTQGHYKGVLRSLRSPNRTLSSIISSLPMHRRDGPTVPVSEDLPRGGDVPTSGSLWGLCDAGARKPRCFALKTKIEIENPICRCGGFPTTNPEDHTWKI